VADTSEPTVSVPGLVRTLVIVTSTGSIKTPVAPKKLKTPTVSRRVRPTLINFFVLSVATGTAQIARLSSSKYWNPSAPASTGSIASRKAISG
jgi:hypothetical protein